MTSNIPTRREIYNQQIFIQEESEETSEVQECISFEEQNVIYKKVGHSDQILNQYNTQTLKINRQKLLKYQPLKQKNRQQTKNSMAEQKNAKIQPPILYSTFRKQNSIKFLKQIKQKVEIRDKKLRNSSNKQNDSSHFLPKMTNKIIKESEYKMNKTTSAINLWKESQNNIFVCQKLNQSNKTYVHSRLKTDNQSIIQKKVSEDQFKLNSYRSNSKLSRNFNKTCSLSKFSTNNEITYSHSEIVKILSKMNQNQEGLLQQKIHLQQRITALRERIQKQNAIIAEINNNKQRMSTSLAKKEVQSKHSVNGAVLSKRKNQNLQNITKNLQQKLQETNQSNNKILHNIDQEKQLIRMYQVVIEEVKSQLKVEKRQKIQFQKKLTIMKNIQKSLCTKFCNHQINNKEILRKIYNSLQKWE